MPPRNCEGVLSRCINNGADVRLVHYTALDGIERPAAGWCAECRDEAARSGLFLKIEVAARIPSNWVAPVVGRSFEQNAGYRESMRDAGRGRMVGQ